MIGSRTRIGDDDTFRQTLTALSRQAGERSAERSSLDPAAAAQARRAALQAHDRARARRLQWALSLAVGAIAGTAIAALVPMITAPPAPTMASAVALPAAPVQEPSSPPSPEPPPVEAASAPAASAPDVPPDAVAAAPITATPTEGALQQDEIREVQARLRSFGFDPGPVDGVAGRMTENAVVRYRQQRGQSQAGAVDRQLLDQLRQDPAPQAAPKPAPTKVAQRPARPDARAPRPATARQPDPLQPVKDGLDGLGRWIDSIVR